MPDAEEGYGSPGRACCGFIPRATHGTCRVSVAEHLAAPWFLVLSAFTSSAYAAPGTATRSRSAGASVPSFDAARMTNSTTERFEASTTTTRPRQTTRSSLVAQRPKGAVREKRDQCGPLSDRLVGALIP
jgi:hypothetical protein